VGSGSTSGYGRYGKFPRGPWADVVEKELGAREYLLPSGFSAADIMLGYGLQLAKLIGQPLGDRPRTVAYLERLAARPAFEKAFAG
jgi:glutathione S-transferase